LFPAAKIKVATESVDSNWNNCIKHNIYIEFGSIEKAKSIEDHLLSEQIHALVKIEQ
jgi:hypothetical protein